MWIISIIITLIILLLLAGAAYQRIETERDARRYPPPGQLMDVGGHRLHIHVEGKHKPGAPTIVFDSGLGATSMSWRLVTPKVTKFARVVTYDRAGLGWSDPSEKPRTARQNVAELRALLGQTGVAPPYLLVGHSFGGFNCRLFASLYPEEVAGLVLVDPIHPSEWLDMTPVQERRRRFGIRLCRRGARLARVGIARAYLTLVIAGRLGVAQPTFHFLSSGAWQVGNRIVESLSKLPHELQPVVLSHWSRPSFFLSTGSHMEHLPESARQVAEAPLPQDLPLTVLSAGDALPHRRQANQQLAATSARGRHLVVENASHFIQFDQPNTVVEAIRLVIEHK